MMGVIHLNDKNGTFSVPRFSGITIQGTFKVPQVHALFFQVTRKYNGGTNYFSFFYLKTHFRHIGKMGRGTEHFLFFFDSGQSS